MTGSWKILLGSWKVLQFILGKTVGTVHYDILEDTQTHPLTSNRHHLSYDDCLENKGRLQDCSCSIGSHHCIQCYAYILWTAPTSQTDLSLSHWVHFTVLRCICVFVFSCISLHACCIIVTRWGGPGGIEDHPPSVLWHCWLGHMTCKNIVPEWPILCRVGR